MAIDIERKPLPDRRHLEAARSIFAAGLRLLSRTAIEGSAEAKAFYAMGDTITANEGDAHGFAMFADVAVAAIDEVLARADAGARKMDFMSLAAHLAKVNAGRETLVRESDGATFVHRDVCIEAMQALFDGAAPDDNGKGVPR